MIPRKCSPPAFVIASVPIGSYSTLSMIVNIHASAQAVVDLSNWRWAAVSLIIYQITLARFPSRLAHR